MLTAFSGNAPVLCLTGQVPSAFIGRGRGHLHEMPDQLGAAQLRKWAERIEHPARRLRWCPAAFQEMLSGRPGPVALEMPWDIFTRRAGSAPQAARRLPPPPPEHAT